MPDGRIRIRANRTVFRQWTECLKLHRAVLAKRPLRERTGDAMLGAMLARYRVQLKTQLGRDWRKHLDTTPAAPAPMPDRAKLDPPPMVD